jgi:hypothetical protein
MNYSSATDTKNQSRAGMHTNWHAPMPKTKPKPALLKGWKGIAKFWGSPHRQDEPRYT